ncbi:MAG: heme biosynthesis HemY N-terminal domain-containing protein, partial [Comamonadaceae bacterium]|nr:heme biosynthesis HemY N-terminal domain-containing protein [Comamonadaceae bacterium]
MRAVLWLVGLFAAAVALALFAGDNEGTVTIFWPPHRVDLSVNLVIVLLAAAFALLHLALRGLTALAELPRQARRWRLQQKERAVHALLLDALVQLSAGRYLRARKSARHALAREAALRAAGEPLEHAATLRALAHLAAAESAHALQDRALREHHLQQALAAQSAGDASGAARPPAQELREGLHLRAARWAVQERDPAAALAWIDGLPHGAARRTLALRTRLKAAQQAGHTAAALDTARLLVKHRAFSADAGRSLVRSLVAERLADTHDAAQLAQAWAALTPAERAEPELALKAAARLAALGGSAATVRAWLQP